MKILDATSGNRSIWFNKNNPIVTFMDIRPEVKPDVLMDCTNINYVGEIYDLIVFDPPHCSMSKNNKGKFGKLYGTFRAGEIRDLVKGAFKEFHRILKPNGFVLFKWNDHDQKLKKMLDLAGDNFEALFGHRVSIRTKHISQTYWVCLRKIGGESRW